METTEFVVRVARSHEALGILLASIELGASPRPDWVHLQAECRLDRLSKQEREATIERLYRCVRRGFRAGNLDAEPGPERLDLWRAIASRGFHDFGDGFTKHYDSPYVEDHDYLAPYLQGGLDALDPYRVYSSVLGSHDYGVEDFLETQQCSDVRTVIEPMAGTAELAYQGHFRFPELRYVMIDVDQEACDHVLARPWLPEAEHHYLVADVLDEGVWQQAKSLSSGPSLAFVGKQSHHLFDARQLYRLLELGTLYANHLVLETPPVTLVGDFSDEEDLTRPEMHDAGLQLALINEPCSVAHPFTNRVDFRLDAWDGTGRRTLFRYDHWTVWSQPTLVAMAELLDLDVFYFHSELEEFVPIEYDASETDCYDNVTFLSFTRRHRDEGQSD